MRMVCLPVALCLSILSLARAFGEETRKSAEGDFEALVAAGKEKLPGLKLELITPRKQYELGEPIEVTMQYTYDGDRKLSVEHTTYNRCGRILAFSFSALGERGNVVRDPIAGHLGGTAGGIRGSGSLARQGPYEQKVFLNEWLCFDAPGRYTVTARSGIVSFDAHGTGESHSGPTIPLKSVPLELQITAPVEEHRLARIAEARTAAHDTDSSAREKAMRDLRFMVDPRAIPL